MTMNCRRNNKSHGIDNYDINNNDCNNKQFEDNRNSGSLGLGVIIILKWILKN
jgi:hypothetical protein